MKSVQKVHEEIVKIEKLWILKKFDFLKLLTNWFDGFEILDGVEGWAMKP